MKRVLTVIFVLFIIFQAFPVMAEQNDSVSNLPALQGLKAESVVLIDQLSGKVLYEKNAHTKMYPASVTKIMTVLLMIEDLNLDDILTVGREINLKAKDASSAGLRIGQKLTVRELIWALMLPSGNDAAYTAAVQVARKKSGDSSMGIPDAVDYFAGLMNKRALEIGAKESNFVNPHGYHDADHYSTAYDLALIAREAMKNEFFRETAKTQNYSFMSDASSTVSKNSEPVQWVNRNLLINKKSKYYYEYATGIKTGYTSVAGSCLVSSAARDDMNIIAVMLKSPEDENRWMDSKTLLEYGLSNFKVHNLFNKGQIISSIKVGKRFLPNTVDLDVAADNEFSDILPKDGIQKIKQTITWDKSLLDPRDDGKGGEKLIGPVSKGQIVGKVTYMLDDKVLAESNLIATVSVMSLNTLDYVLSAGEYVLKHWYIVAIPLTGLVILFVGVKVAKARRRNKSTNTWKHHRY